MPNYVKSVIKCDGISGMPFYSGYGENKGFDFNKLIPMPDELDIVEGSVTNDYIKYVLRRHAGVIEGISEDTIKKAREISKYGVTDYVDKEKAEKYGMQYLRNLEKFGYCTWYGWCNKYWGTKWNAMNTYFYGDDVVGFETAWETPIPVFEKIAEMYPDKRFIVQYADECGCGCGVIHIANGKVEICECEEGSEEEEEIYRQCWE